MFRKPEEVTRLVEIPKIQSTEASNAIKPKLGKITKFNIKELCPSLLFMMGLSLKVE